MISKEDFERSKSTPEQRAQLLNIYPELEVPSPRRVVITGFAQRTPLGATEETYQGLLQGRSGVVSYDIGHPKTKIAALLPETYQPKTILTQTTPISPKELRGATEITAMALETTIEAMCMANALTDEKTLDPSINRNRVGSFIGSGYGPSSGIIDLATKVREKGMDRFRPSEAIVPFPEQMNADIARFIKISSYGANSTEACATGLSNPVLAYNALRYGFCDMAVTGGYEMLLRKTEGINTGNADVTIAIFTSFGALSTRNDDPSGASRPFDANRDGFVLGDGGATVVLEDYEHAKKRGANILAEVIGVGKSNDGHDITQLDPVRTGGVVLNSLFNRYTGEYVSPDVLMMHATGTPLGERKESRVYHYALGDQIVEIPCTAIKDRLGHEAGGAGAINLVTALQVGLNDLLPPIWNLETPDIYDKDFPDDFQAPHPNFTRNQPLRGKFKHIQIGAYGFGGYSSSMLIRMLN